MSTHRLVPIMGLFAIGLLLGSPAASQPITTTSTVHRIPSGSEVMGASSTLRRTANAIHMQVKTSDLDPGAAYTVWWVIFNLPGNCIGPCDLEDILDESQRALTQVAVGYAAGHVVGRNGKGNFAARLSEGDTTGFGGGTDAELPPPFGPGLLDAMGAEVHLVIRTHGAPVPGLVDEQIHTFEGACDVNFCEDRQFSVHLPPQ